MMLSIIVLNYRAGDLLLDCLASVFADSVPFEREVILIDNHSQDDSFARAVDRFGSQLSQAIRNPKNGGFAYGNNIGIRASRGKYICTLNPDTHIHPGAFAALVNALEQTPDAGFVGPKVLTTDGEVEWSALRMIPRPLDAFARATGLSTLFPNDPRWTRFEASWLDPELPQQVEASTGCCMVARRDMLDQIGLLDERFFLYCEDVDWFLRARDAGWTVHYVPEAVIVHQHAYSASFRRYRSILDHHTSMLRFYQKHYAATHSTPINALMYAGVITRLGLKLGLRTVQR